MTATWPDRYEVPVDRDAAETFSALQSAVEKVRNLRSEMGLAPREAFTIDVPRSVPAEVASLLGLLTASQVSIVDGTSTGITDGLAAVEGRAPRGVMLERLRKAATHLRSEVDRGEKKLSNTAFTSKAAPEVVAKEREKLEGYRGELARTLSQLAELEKG